MKSLLFALICTFQLAAYAQLSPEMTASGFAPVILPAPSRPLEKQMELAKAWAPYYNKEGFDIYDISPNGMTVDARKNNAFYYRNRGELYSHDIVYTLKIVFNDNNTYTMAFNVKEMYANKVLLRTTVADFFAPDGRLKEDYEEVRPSLERTVAKIMGSFSAFIAD